MEVRKLSQLLADYEKTADETKNELAEIKATMIVNFDGGYEHNPKLLDGTEKTALEMFMKIIDYYYKASGDKHQSENGKLPIPHVVGRSELLTAFVEYCYKDHKFFIPSWMVDGYLL